MATGTATLSTSSNPSAPLTRSRTNLFLSYRDSAIRPTSTSFAGGGADYNDDFDDEGNTASESNRLLTDETVIDMAEFGARRGSVRSGTTSLPPQWIDVSDAVDEILNQVKPKMDRLDKLHAKHVLPGFKDRSAEEREIEALANEITNDFRATQKHIRKIADMSRQLLGTSPRSSIRNPESTRLELIMAANVQTALATKVQELSGLFRKKQTAYLKQIRGHEGRSSVSVGGIDSGRDPLAALAEDEQYSLQSQRTAVAPGLSIDVAQREQEILNIAQSITDLSDLFKDLSSLVIDQGTLLDRVDYNVEQMNVEVKKAVTELKTATTQVHSC
ncbi:t-SNARE affecting a late Golgi compartment protein 2 [Microbotryomycetes sp. JL201]|nr:t-SNARE affecting a late Golgi compartment protein 2 [Microbotryomycetes sp. JL201]